MEKLQKDGILNWNIPKRMLHQKNHRHQFDCSTSDRFNLKLLQTMTDNSKLQTGMTANGHLRTRVMRTWGASHRA
jgi:hypothetical protein